MDLVEALRMPDKREAIREMEAELVRLEEQVKPILELRDALREVAKMPPGRPFMPVAGEYRKCAADNCDVTWWTGAPRPGDRKGGYKSMILCSSKCRSHFHRQRRAEPRP